MTQWCLIPSFPITSMSFAQALRKFSQPNLAHSADADAGSGTSDNSNNLTQRRQASEPTLTKSRFWRVKRPPTPHRSNLSQPTPTQAENSTSTDGVIAMPSPAPLPTTPDVFATNFYTAPPPEMIPPVSPVPDKLAEAWDAIKDGPSIPKAKEGLDTIGASSSLTSFLKYPDSGF